MFLYCPFIYLYIFRFSTKLIVHTLPTATTKNQKHDYFIEILHLWAKFQAAMVSCSRIIWITNFSDHRFELRISCIRSSYLTHYAIRPNWLADSEYPNSLPYDRSSWSMLRYFEPSFYFYSCLKVGNSSTPNPPNLLGLMALWVRKLLRMQEIGSSNLLWSLEFVIQINLKHDTIAASLL